MFTRSLLWRLLALLALPWLPARAQTLPHNGFADAQTAASHAHHDHFFQRIRTDPRLSSGLLPG